MTSQGGKIMKTIRLFLPLLALAALALSGCGGSATGEGLVQDEITMRDQQIADLQQELTARDQAMAQVNNELAETRTRATDAERELAGAQAATTATAMMSGDSTLLPPNAKPGECFARVVVPPVYETTTERVLVKEAGERIEIIPAKYEWTEERVLVKEASTRIETVPATYETVEEQVLVKAASTEIVDVPATYETVQEQVLVTPARTYWKKGRGLVEKVDNNTGEIMCLVEEPAVYRTVSKRVVKTPATTRETTVPAEYKTVRKQVVKTPATTRTVEIPAEYGTVKVRKLVEPAREKRIPIEAEYADITKRTMTEASHMEWRRVLCETNMNNATVLDLQKALQNKGFDPGPLDGVYGSKTQAALHAFQKSKSMPVGGLTYEAMEALGVRSSL